jgi:hypothetical protein
LGGKDANMYCRLAAVFSAVVVAACSHNASPIAAPSDNVVASFTQKAAGKWLLTVDGAALNQTVRPSAFTCAAHEIPLELSGAFSTSVVQTLRNGFEEVELISPPIPGGQARRRGAKGVIVVRGEDTRAHLDIKSGFWKHSMKTQVSIVASVYVDGPSGRAFDMTVEGQSTADAESGDMCIGGTKSVTDAGAAAIRDTVRKLAEALASSEKVRAMR